MTLPIPTPAVLAQRFAAWLAQQSFVASDGTTVRLDATAPQTLEQAISIVSALDLYQIYLYARDIGLELMVTTATEGGLLPQHSKIWGVPREGAVAAIGNFVIASTANSDVTIPAGTLITVDGSAQWATDATVTIAPGAVASVAVQATVTGVTGNLAANISAQLVSPISGVATVTTDQNGISGGAPIQPVESWRAAIIDAIRNPPGGGNRADYIRWARAAGAMSINVIPGWLGRGSVGVIVTMTLGITPSDIQIAAVQSYIDAVRPVRGNVTVSGAIAVSQDLTLVLNPDTPSARNAVTKALTAYYLGLPIGGTIYRAGIDATITAVAGAQNTVISPIGDTALAENQQAALGVINWAARP
ncbi:baseplate J/gp47 family protein [Asaia siamensis]